MRTGYKIFGLGVRSDIDLGIKRSRASCHLQLQVSNEFKRRRRAGPQVYRLGRSGQARLDLPGFGEFILENRTLLLCLDRPQEIENIQSVILNQGIPFALAQMGEILMHAAAIKLGHGVVLFAGPSGVGKSNLAARFASHGFKILSDNMVRLDTKSDLVYPAFPEIRLFPKDVPYFQKIANRQKGSFDKRRLSIASEYCSRPAALRKIYFLKKGRFQLKRRQLEPLEKFAAVMSNSAVYADSRRVQTLRRFRRLVRLCAEIPMETLSIPHRRNEKSDLKRLLKLADR